VTTPGLDEIAPLSRELVIVSDASAQILWADSRAGSLIGAWAGRNLRDLCLPGTADKAAELASRGVTGPMRAWELTVLANNRPATVSFSGKPWNGNVLLVGQLLASEYQDAIGNVQAALTDVVSLNREIVRQKHEITRYAERLAESNRELEESNQGVLALHRELDDRADALSRSGEIKSRVVSSVSHEFRTPLNSVLGLTELLLEGSDGPLNEEQQKQVRFIRSSAEELMALVNDLLDLSKIEAGKVTLRATRFGIQEFLASMRGSLRPLVPTGAPVTLHFEEVEPDFELETDRAKLSQVARNLVSNALKFTERGEVVVSVRRVDDDQVAMSVRDTGIGIPSELVDHIFEEFSQVDNPLQTRVKGTGLGLPISRRVAQLLGGDIVVESTVGEGSTFTLVIPREHPDVTEMHQIEARSRRRDPSKSAVLVVEDDRRSMFVYERFLSMAGFQVIPARTVDAARAALEETVPTAIVLDVMLEEETTWRFLADVKRDPRTQHVPVLVVTVTNKEERARALGADEFWLKPIDQDRLLRKLKSLVRAERTVKVLVIDDDVRARYLIRKHIEGEPHELLEASTAAEGLRLAREQMPSVIFLDFLLERGTAFDVLDELKADPRTRAIPVIIVTSHVLGDHERELLSAGTEAVISKQNLSRELAINRIRDALRKGGMESRP
jgi:signal transduction histidine kinase/CheY-like chemotaxis protein